MVKCQRRNAHGEIVWWRECEMAVPGVIILGTRTGEMNHPSSIDRVKVSSIP